MALSSNEDKFTVTCKVQNFSMCVFEDGESLDSPGIFVELLDKTTWQLRLYPNDENKVSCCLKRIENEDSSDTITIDCSMTLVSVDNLLNITKTRSCCVFDEQDCEEFVFGKIDDIFAKRDVLLPGDIITIRCCMWRTDRDFKEPAIPTRKEMSVATTDPEEKPISDQTTVVKDSLIEHVYVGKVGTLDGILSENMYLSAKKNLEDLKKHLLPTASFLRTHISCERRCRIWEIKKFNEIQINDRIFTSVVSAVASAPSFVLTLYLSKDVDGNDDVHIDIQINYDNKYRYVVKCIVTILNSLYEDQGCIQDKHFFNDDNDIWHLPLIKKSKLCKDQYLKKGSLLLRCDLVISEQGNVHAIEDYYISFPSVQDTTDERDLDEWKMGLLRTRKDGDFCDVILEAGKQQFKAHKIILSSSSSVFKDLLDDDFDEQTLDIADCEPEILDKLLEYMYSGVLGKMTNEHLMKLYSAAKTYKVEALERQCSCKLRFSLDLYNVSEVLLFADSEQDEVLKMAAMKFISVFPDEVFHSLSWKKCMGENAKIAAEAMHYVLTRKFVQ